MKGIHWLLVAGLLAFGACNKSERKFDCKESNCGCATEEAAAVSLSVLDSKKKPAAGIAVYCEGEQKPVTHTDKHGKFSVDLKLTRTSCGYDRCGRFNLVDLSRRHEWFSLTLEEARSRKDPVELVAASAESGASAAVAATATPDMKAAPAAKPALKPAAPKKPAGSGR